MNEEYILDILVLYMCIIHILFFIDAISRNSKRLLWKTRFFNLNIIGPRCYFTRDCALFHIRHIIIHCWFENICMQMKKCKYLTTIVDLYLYIHISKYHTLTCLTLLFIRSVFKVNKYILYPFKILKYFECL